MRCNIYTLYVISDSVIIIMAWDSEKGSDSLKHMWKEWKVCITFFFSFDDWLGWMTLQEMTCKLLTHHIQNKKKKNKYTDAAFSLKIIYL